MFCSSGMLSQTFDPFIVFLQTIVMKKNYQYLLEFTNKIFFYSFWQGEPFVCFYKY